MARVWACQRPLNICLAFHPVIAYLTFLPLIGLCFACQTSAASASGRAMQQPEQTAMLRQAPGSGALPPSGSVAPVSPVDHSGGMPVVYAMQPGMHAYSHPSGAVPIGFAAPGAPVEFPGVSKLARYFQ